MNFHTKYTIYNQTMVLEATVLKLTCACNEVTINMKVNDPQNTNSVGIIAYHEEQIHIIQESLSNIRFAGQKLTDLLKRHKSHIQAINIITSFSTTKLTISLTSGKHSPCISTISFPPGTNEKTIVLDCDFINYVKDVNMTVTRMTFTNEVEIILEHFHSFVHE